MCSKVLTSRSETGLSKAALARAKMDTARGCGSTPVDTARHDSSLGCPFITQPRRMMADCRRKSCLPTRTACSLLFVKPINGI